MACAKRSRDRRLFGAGGDDEGADIIGLAAALGRDEIGEREIGPAVAAQQLLAQREQRGELFAARFAGVEADVVADGIGRPEADDGLRTEPALGDDLLQHDLRVLEQAARRRALFRILEERRIAALQVPGLEERRPVDSSRRVRRHHRIVNVRVPRKRRFRRNIGLPVAFQRIGAGAGERQALLVGLAAPMGFGDALIFGAQSLDILRARRRREQGGDDADGAARIVDIDGLAARVMRVNLDGGMDAARRRAADQQRHVEARTFHLARHEAHFVERRRDEAREADHVDLLADRRLDDPGGRHHHAEIDDLVIVAGEHDADDVLADVVDVALHRRHEDLAGIRPHAPVLCFSASMKGIR